MQSQWPWNESQSIYNVTIYANAISVDNDDNTIAVGATIVVYLWRKNQPHRVRVARSAGIRMSKSTVHVHTVYFEYVQNEGGEIRGEKVNELAEDWTLLSYDKK